MLTLVPYVLFLAFEQYLEISRTHSLFQILMVMFKDWVTSNMVVKAPVEILSLGYRYMQFRDWCQPKSQIVISVVK